VKCEEKIVLDLLCEELGRSGFQVDDSFGNWKIRRLYDTPDGFRYSMSWYSSAYYRGGEVRIFADWVGEKILSLADPQFGANLRSFLNNSWDKHLGEVAKDGFQG
jgi:hypothetical protein